VPGLFIGPIDEAAAGLPLVELDGLSAGLLGGISTGDLAGL
jgi:hypothetical protein